MTTWTPPNPKTFEWWNQANDCYDAAKPNPPITTEPITGYYRATLHKGGPFLPFVYFYEGETLYLQVGGETDSVMYGDNSTLPNGQTIREAWPFVSKRPVRMDKYDYYNKHGRWPDASEAVYEAATNYPPPDMHPDSFAALAWQINPLLIEAQKLIDKGGAKTKEEAQAANDLHNRLIERFKLLDNKITLKERIERDPRITPQVKEGYDVYAKTFTDFRELLRACEIYKTLKDTVIEPYLLRLEAEAKAANKPPPKAPLSGGTGGRAVSLTKRKVARIDKYDDALLHFMTHKDIADTVQKLANAMARQGVAAPGCTIIDEKDAV